jgi:hypothetical protein
MGFFVVVYAGAVVIMRVSVPIFSAPLEVEIIDSAMASFVFVAGLVILNAMVVILFSVVVVVMVRKKLEATIQLCPGKFPFLVKSTTFGGTQRVEFIERPLYLIKYIPNRRSKLVLLDIFIFFILLIV